MFSELIRTNLADPAHNLGLSPVNLGDGRIHLGSLQTHQLTLNSLHLVQSGQSGGVAEGGYFSVDDGNQLVTFEFDADDPADTTAGNIRIAIVQADTNEDIADAIVNELIASDLGLQPIHLGEGRIFVGGNVNHQLTTDPMDTRFARTNPLYSMSLWRSVGR